MGAFWPWCCGTAPGGVDPCGGVCPDRLMLVIPAPEGANENCQIYGTYELGNLVYSQPDCRTATWKTDPIDLTTEYLDAMNLDSERAHWLIVTISIQQRTGQRFSLIRGDIFRDGRTSSLLADVFHTNTDFFTGYSLCDKIETDPIMFTIPVSGIQKYYFPQQKICPHANLETVVISAI